MVDVECVVVGGGIAGLTATYYLRERDVLLLEGSERLGGRVKSVPDRASPTFRASSDGPGCGATGR